MVTSWNRVIVSIASLALAACTRLQPPVSSGVANGPTPDDYRAPTISFDNQAGTYVDIYLVSDRRQWRLGRVMPGARMSLRLPDDDLADISGFVRLAALANANTTVQVTRDPHTVITIAQPLSVLLSQGWSFSHQESTSDRLQGAPLRRP